MGNKIIFNCMFYLNRFTLESVLLFAWLLPGLELPTASSICTSVNLLPALAIQTRTPQYTTTL